MFKPAGPFCQSCGMPLSNDEQGGGTEADGTKSSTYCSNCYQDGSFTEPDLTAAEMVEKAKAKMAESGLPGFLAGRFAKGIPELERWR